MGQDLRNDEVCGIVMAGLAGATDPKLAVGDVVMDERSDAAVELPFARVKMQSVEKIVSTPGERAALFASSGAAVVEMENDRVRAAAEKCGIPYIGIRAISDSAGQTLEAALLRLVDEAGRVKVGALLALLVRRPGMVRDLMRLRKNAALAVANLAKAVRVVVDEVRRNQDVKLACAENADG
jgi:adenosylhomocysteine nucleosidase